MGPVPEFIECSQSLFIDLWSVTKQVTFIISLITPWMTKIILYPVYLRDKYVWRKAIMSRVSYFVLSTTYQVQASGGHIQSNAALIVFAVFWTGRLSRYNAISNAGEKKALQSFLEQWQSGRQTCQPVKLSGRPSLTLSIDGPII